MNVVVVGANPPTRRRLGLPPGVPVISTFGPLSEDKGIELVIQAMALLRGEHSDLHYVVAGRTDPEVVKHDGERYRQCLAALADELGLDDRVIFLDRFLEPDELAALVGVSDIVCTPYHAEHHSMSGVLTLALAAGCAIVSTPYRCARELLSEGAGVLVDFGDDEGFADAIHGLLAGRTKSRARVAVRPAPSETGLLEMQFAP